MDLRQPDYSALASVRMDAVGLCSAGDLPAGRDVRRPVCTILHLGHTADIRADLLRREEDGTWPDNPLTLTLGDTVTLGSIDFTAPIAAFYRIA
jgi:hypothetical protein